MDGVKSFDVIKYDNRRRKVGEIINHFGSPRVTSPSTRVINFPNAFSLHLVQHRCRCPALACHVLEHGNPCQTYVRKTLGR